MNAWSKMHIGPRLATSYAVVVVVAPELELEQPGHLAEQS